MEVQPLASDVAGAALYDPYRKQGRLIFLVKMPAARHHSRSPSWSGAQPRGRKPQCLADAVSSSLGAASERRHS